MTNLHARLVKAVRSGTLSSGFAYINEFGYGEVGITCNRSKEATEIIRQIKFEYGPERS